MADPYYEKRKLKWLKIIAVAAVYMAIADTIILFTAAYYVFH